MPEPDSPTMPSTLPRSTVKDTRSTAFAMPALVWNSVERLLTLSSDMVGFLYTSSFGLSTVRNWSPTSVMATTSSTSAMPGKTLIQYWLDNM